MIVEAVSSAVLGLVLAWTAALRLSHRLPARPLVLSTGVAGALLGVFVTNGVLEAGGLPLALAGAVTVAVASLSLLLRPPGRGRLRERSATA